MKLLTTPQLRTAAVIIVFSFLIITVARLNNQLTECQTRHYSLLGGDISKAEFVDSIVKVNDSLRMELFPLETQLTRYQVAFGILAERNPKAAKQYGDIISNETE